MRFLGYKPDVWDVVLIVFLVAGLVLFGGCATLTETVHVPVPVPCDPPRVEKPSLPVDSLPEKSDIFSQVKALWASLELMEGYAGQLQTAVDACRSE